VEISLKTGERRRVGGIVGRLLVSVLRPLSIEPPNVRGGLRRSEIISPKSTSATTETRSIGWLRLGKDQRFQAFIRLDAKEARRNPLLDRPPKSAGYDLHRLVDQSRPIASRERICCGGRLIEYRWSGARRSATRHPIDDAGSIEPIGAQGGQERQRAPAAVRDFRDQSLAARRAPVGACHVGLGPGLVDEDEARGIKPALILLPLCPPPRDVRAILLAGVQAFF